MKNQKNKNLIFKIIPLVILTLFTFGNLSQNALAENCSDFRNYGCYPKNECISDMILKDVSGCGDQVCCIPKSNEEYYKDFIENVRKSRGFIIENPLGETSDIYTLVDNIINFLFGIAILLTPIIIIYAGFVYITSAGNEEKIKTAQKIIIWALIGFAVVLLAKGIPQLITNFLQGS